MTDVVMIAAVSGNVIGKDGALPWHIPEELKFFQSKTKGCAVIVGRKTFESMPSSVWKTRKPFVLSKSLIHSCEEQKVDGVICSDLELLIEVAGRYSDTVYIAGGVDLFYRAMGCDGKPLANKLLISHIHDKHEGDTYLPPIPSCWVPTVGEAHQKFNVLMYSRRLD